MLAFVFLIIVTNILAISSHSFCNSSLDSSNHFSSNFSQNILSLASLSAIFILLIKSFLLVPDWASEILAPILVQDLNN
jgi:hypothetical protein